MTKPFRVEASQQANDSSSSSINEVENNRNEKAVQLLDNVGCYSASGLSVRLMDPTDDNYTEVVFCDDSEENETNSGNEEYDRWYELAKGYDMNDPFIDNEHAAGKAADKKRKKPSESNLIKEKERMHIEHGKFYVNKGPIKVRKEEAKANTPKAKEKEKEKEKETTKEKEKEKEKEAPTNNNEKVTVLKTGENPKETTLEVYNRLLTESFSEEDRRAVAEQVKCIAGFMKENGGEIALVKEPVFAFCELIFSNFAQKQRFSFLHQVCELNALTKSKLLSLLYQTYISELLFQYEKMIEAYKKFKNVELTNVDNYFYTFSVVDWEQVYAVCRFYDRINLVSKFFSKKVGASVEEADYGERIYDILVGKDNNNNNKCTRRKFYTSMFLIMRKYTKAKNKGLKPVGFLKELAGKYGATDAEFLTEATNLSAQRAAEKAPGPSTVNSQNTNQSQSQSQKMADKQFVEAMLQQSMGNVSQSQPYTPRYEPEGYAGQNVYGSQQGSYQYIQQPVYYPVSENKGEGSSANSSNMLPKLSLSIKNNYGKPEEAKGYGGYERNQ